MKTHIKNKGNNEQGSQGLNGSQITETDKKFIGENTTQREQKICNMVKDMLDLNKVPNNSVVALQETSKEGH